MNKYLIFRTDRIGDFLLSMILIKSIKRNDKNSYIIVVSSKKNYDYIKTFNLIDEVIDLKKGYINRVKLILKLLKQYAVIPEDSQPKIEYDTYDWTLSLGNYVKE